MKPKTKMEMAKVVVTALYNLDKPVTEKNAEAWRHGLRLARRSTISDLESLYEGALAVLRGRKLAGEPKVPSPSPVVFEGENTFIFKRREQVEFYHIFEVKAKDVYEAEGMLSDATDKADKEWVKNHKFCTLQIIENRNVVSEVINHLVGFQPKLKEKE